MERNSVVGYTHEISLIAHLLVLLSFPMNEPFDFADACRALSNLCVLKGTYDDAEADVTNLERLLRNFTANDHPQFVQLLIASLVYAIDNDAPRPRLDHRCPKFNKTATLASLQRIIKKIRWVLRDQMQPTPAPPNERSFSRISKSRKRCMASKLIDVLNAMSSELLNQSFWLFSHQNNPNVRFPSEDFSFFHADDDRPQPKRIPFTYIATDIHHDRITDVFAHEGKVMLKGFHGGDYYGPPKIWFAPLQRQLPAQSRYGCIRIIIPFDRIVELFPKAFLLGIRSYEQSERSLTHLLTPSDTSVYNISHALDPIAIDDFRTATESKSPIVWYDGEEKTWCWNRYYSDQDKCDALHFAVATDALWGSDDFKIEFVSHTQYCIKLPRGAGPIDDGDECKFNAEQAMKHFWETLGANKVDKLRAAGFFGDEVWESLTRFRAVPTDESSSSSKRVRQE